MLLGGSGVYKGSVTAKDLSFVRVPDYHVTVLLGAVVGACMKIALGSVYADQTKVEDITTTAASYDDDDSSRHHHIGGIVGYDSTYSVAGLAQDACIFNSYSTAQIIEDHIDGGSGRLDYTIGGIAGLIEDTAVNNYFGGSISLQSQRREWVLE
ncbi:MAG: hypothetical protein LBP35_01070 [Candidatus Ancillula trichonymphae]|jgi:hypothetical protein|nr:hypothetical protein [Candidatus Ancillula trichonymphae]